MRTTSFLSRKGSPRVRKVAIRAVVRVKSSSITMSYANLCQEVQRV